MEHNERTYRSNPGIIPGLIVIGIGLLFLFNNLNIFDIHDLWRYWPVILIAGGLAKLVEAPHGAGTTGGAVLMAVGGICLANNLGFFRWSWHDYWPLLLIGAGALMLWNRLYTPTWVPPAAAAGAGAGAPPPEGTLNLHAVFGGVERKVATDDFRGGHITAMFGGVEVNLRKAGMRGDYAVIDINAMFGGVELKVPANWMVVVEGTSIFGGVSDETAHPSPDSPGVKKLILRGGAVFGGVGVKN